MKAGGRLPVEDGQRRADDRRDPAGRGRPQYVSRWPRRSPNTCRSRTNRCRTRSCPTANTRRSMRVGKRLTDIANTLSLSVKTVSVPLAAAREDAAVEQRGAHVLRDEQPARRHGAHGRRLIPRVTRFVPPSDAAPAAPPPRCRRPKRKRLFYRTILDSSLRCSGSCAPNRLKLRFSLSQRYRARARWRFIRNVSSARKTSIA